MRVDRAAHYQSTSDKLSEHLRKLEDICEVEESAREKQHSKGKLSARERIAKALDPGSFLEIDKFVVDRLGQENKDANHLHGDSVVTGLGTVLGRQVAIYSQDFTVFGGSLGEAAGDKIIKIMDIALSARIPIIGILDSGGARIQEGVVALGKYGEIFKRNTLASGVIPQISIVCGPAAGGAVYSPALTDFVIMVEDLGKMFVTGPDVILAVTGEKVTMEDLGGGLAHNSRSGVSHFLAADEDDAFDFARILMSYLPANFETPPPVYSADASVSVTPKDRLLDSIIPDNSSSPYDVRTIIESLADEGSFLEVQPLFASNIVVGFSRFDGQSVGVIANQPIEKAGTLDIDAAEKAARFLRFCDAFSIPVVTIVDVPGYLPGTDQEWSGVIRRGAKLLYAYAEATIPLVTIITRKAYGGAYIVMGSKQLGSDFCFAWPSAEIAVMGGQGAVNILYREELRQAEEDGKDLEDVRASLVSDYLLKLASPYVAAERGELDGVIEPSQTRLTILQCLKTLAGKKQQTAAKKHGNIPL